MNLDELYFKDNFTKENGKVNLEVDKLTVDCITSKNNKFSIDNLGNINVQSVNAIQPIIDMIYPVGSIYISIIGTNPSNYFGGAWERIKDRFLLASGDIYANNTTGGESTHTLTIDEMPSHNHFYRASTSAGNAEATLQFGWDGFVISGTYGNSIQNTGGNQAHNNMPPYLAVYIWKRIR